MIPLAERQEPPFCIQVEPTEGCNLRCAFCAISSIRESGKAGDRSGPYKYMTVETAELLARQMAEAQWNSRIEFALHGEPTRNENLPIIVRNFRRWLPKVNMMLTTNALPLVERGFTQSVLELFDAGVNVIALDDYKPHKASAVARERNAAGWAKFGVEFREYPAEVLGNPHHRRKPKDRPMLTVVQDISEATFGTHSKLNNHAGCAAPPLPEPVMKKCVKPFREISVRWDGGIAICCNDWRGEYKIGYVTQTHIETLWQSEPFRVARRLLNAADRDFGVCRGCDEFGGYRQGLITNGRTLPPPTDEDRARAEAAMEGEPMTPAVDRKWETEITLSRKPR